MDDFIPCVGGVAIFFMLFSFIAVMRYMGYRETLALAERGLVKPEKRNGKGGLVWGIILTSVGLALCIGLYPIGFFVGGREGNFPLGLGPWLLPGLLTMFFGLGLIIAHVLTREPKDKEARPPIMTPAPAAPAPVAPPPPLPSTDASTRIDPPPGS